MKSTLRIEIPLWQLVVVLCLPLLYVANAQTPWTQGLWSTQDKSFYYAFWLSILAIHVLTAIVVLKFIRLNGIAFQSIGLTSSGRTITIAIGSLIAIGLIAVAFRMIAGYQNTDDLGFQIGWPENTQQRLFWIPIYIAAGAIEELVYRGFALTALRGRGIRDWQAVLISSLSFSLIHGGNDLVITAISLFWGVVFSVIYLWKRSLLLVMCIHAISDWSFIVTP